MLLKRAFLTLACALTAFCLTARAGERTDEEYEEALLCIRPHDRRVTLVRLDGTTSTHQLPMPLGRSSLEHSAIDVTPWGKLVYVGYYYEGRLGEAPVGARDDDGSVQILYTGFFSNALNKLAVLQISVSPDGTKLALTARDRAREADTLPALFCLDLLNGKLVQVTPFDEVVRGPKWSNKSDKVAFYFGTGQPKMSEHEKMMALYIVEEPFSPRRRLVELAPRMIPEGFGAGSTPPAWAAEDTVIYFQAMYKGDRGRFMYRASLSRKKIERLGPGGRPVSNDTGTIVGYTGFPFGSGAFIVEDHDSPPSLFVAGKASSPVISHSGRYVCFYVQEEGKRAEMRIVQRQTAKVVCTFEPVGSVNWIRVWKPSLPFVKKAQNRKE